MHFILVFVGLSSPSLGCTKLWEGYLVARGEGPWLGHLSWCHPQPTAQASRGLGHLAVLCHSHDVPLRWEGLRGSCEPQFYSFSSLVAQPFSLGPLFPGRCLLWDLRTCPCPQTRQSSSSYERPQLLTMASFSKSLCSFLQLLSFLGELGF